MLPTMDAPQKGTRMGGPLASMLSLALLATGCGAEGVGDPDSRSEEAPGCGDGEVSAQEECDDGDDIGGDGCSSSCSTEPGYVCSARGCVEQCGDGIRTQGESCDDGNRQRGDGCAQCGVEQGWWCPAAGAPCLTSCGDGVRASSEECEDANSLPGDGCSDACLIEAGWDCSPGRYGTDYCWTACGDGVRAGSEGCDDGNKDDGDGCTRRCAPEVCADGLCTEPNWAGAECRVDAHCFYGHCNQGSGLCGKSAEGGACTVNRDCDDHCNAVTQLCGRSTTGGPCARDSDCLESNCHPGRLTCGLSEPGEECESDAWCDWGYCVGKTCVAFTRVRQPCASDRECETGHCGRGWNDLGYDVCTASAGTCGTSCYQDACLYGCQHGCEFEDAPVGCIGCGAIYRCN